MNEIIIYNYLSGQATEEEKRQLLAWLQASEANRTLFCKMKAIWQARRLADSVANLNQAHLNKSLAQLNRRIDAFTSPTPLPTSKHRFFYSAVATAAILLVMISMAYLSLVRQNSADKPNDEWVSYAHPANSNEVASFYLPDSTQVWLDRATTLAYPVRFNGDIRKVKLEGTAFFEVRQDAAHPFIVHTPDCKIKVLGTAFSIHTRTPGQQAKTILMNGSVELLDLADHSLARLRPGQQALLSPDDRSVEIREVDAGQMTAWRFGITTLSDLSAGELIHALETMYSIRIEMDTAVLAGRRYHFTFKRSNSPETIVCQLAYITGIPAHIRPSRQ